MGPTRVPGFGLEQIILMVSALLIASASSAVIAVLISALEDWRGSRRRQDRLAHHLSAAVEQGDWTQVESVARRAFRHRQRILVDRSLALSTKYDEVRRILDGPDAIIAWFPVTTRQLGSETEMTFGSKNHVRVQMSWNPGEAFLEWTAEDEEAHVPFIGHLSLQRIILPEGAEGTEIRVHLETDSSRRARATLERWLPSLERGLSTMHAELAG
jgi:hypothetical protein